ncbi:MAG: tail fiber domain-containing protein [Flavobacteriales bacterium]
MKQTVLRPWTMAACVLAMLPVRAQVSTPANNGSTGDFVGWDNTMISDPLQIRHDANQSIDWYTNAIQRVRLSPNVTSAMGPFNEFPNVNRDGFFLLSGQPDAFTNAGSRTPFTRLHLVDQVGGVAPVVYAQEHGFRPWQRNGITFTGNSDQSYIGHKYAGNDNTDFVVQWSDNPSGSPWGTDRMKFVFTTEYDPAASRGAATLDGLEAIRLWPRDNIEVNVGIGDFAQVGAGDPTERVDMLDGRLRIRQLPTDPPANYLTKVLVVEDFPLIPGEHGVVKWRDVSTIVPPPTPECDWTVENFGTSGPAVSHNVYTAVNTSDDCPDNDDAVGIGLNLTNVLSPGKLAVRTANFANALHVNQGNAAAAATGIDLLVSGATTMSRGINISAAQGNDPAADNRGISIRASGSGITANNWNYGLRADLSGASYRTRGVSGFTHGARFSGYAGWFIADDDAQWTSGVAAFGRGGAIRRGVEGHAQGEGELQVGVHGYASLVPATWVMPSAKYIGVAGQIQKQDVQGERFFAVYGHTDVVDGDTWAGYFEGNVHITGDASCTNMAWTSDESLKTDIENLTQGLAIISELRPTTYHFNTDAIAQANLPSSNQFGFIAQEVEEVLPELVGQTTFIGRIDSLGNVVVPEQTVKTLNYVGLIPILVAGMQEQQAQISAQNATIAAMQQQLAACCAAPPTDSDQRSGSVPAEEKLTPAQERLLRIAPNPFTDRTTLYCTLERAGRMQLMANSSDGRDLRMLSEGQREAGEFQYEWSTEHLATGVYYVTLLLDGEPVVKRAVKVGR